MFFKYGAVFGVSQSKSSFYIFFSESSKVRYLTLSSGRNLARETEKKISKLATFTGTTNPANALVMGKKGDQQG